MSDSSRSSMFPLCLLRLLLAGILFAMCAFASAATDYVAMDGQKIVTASAVRIRSTPTTSAEESGRLGIGMVVHAVRRTSEKVKVGSLQYYWYYVQAPKARGWVLGRFLSDFKASAQDQIWSDLARSRVKKEALSFADAVDLVAFIDAARPKVKNNLAQGWLELARLVALQKSVDSLDYERSQERTYSEWLAKYKQLIFHDEISGQWLVNANAYWALEKRFSATQVGDEIAWHAASAQLGGECEGDIACNLYREEITNAEYLSLYPKGLHVAESLVGMGNVFAYILDELKTDSGYFKNARESGRAIDRMLRTVEAANPKVKERARVLQQLKLIQAIYKKQ